MAAAVPEGRPRRASDWLELNGKVALITGGASGLGSACACELARHGVKCVPLPLLRSCVASRPLYAAQLTRPRRARVAIADVRSKLEGRQQAHKIAVEAAKVVEAQDADDAGLTCEPIYVECDVSSRASVEAAVAAVAEKLGGIDVLINNGARLFCCDGGSCGLTDARAPAQPASTCRASWSTPPARHAAHPSAHMPWLMRC
jgi:NAD(P)-dependent dehydrogenase (short-subunit alcohol dehydrogenase family)